MKKLVLLTLVLSMLSGCITTYQFVEPQTSYDVEGIKPNMAQIIFLRPSKGVMGAFNAVVFDITGEQRNLIGVAPAKSKFAIDIAPGDYKFLSANGLPAHVMDLSVESGKQYYVLVRPIYGNGFQLRPIKHGIGGEFDFKNPKFESWKTTTKVAVKAPGADEWYEKFASQIDKTQMKALEVWSEKDDAQRLLLTLLPEDAK